MLSFKVLKLGGAHAAARVHHVARGGAATWPLAARAQQGGMRRVAVLMPYPPTDAEMQGRVQALRQGLGKLGWRTGVNIQFDERWTTDNMDLVAESTLPVYWN